jgi:uncharacterized protein YqgC (DUF456 family)
MGYLYIAIILISAFVSVVLASIGLAGTFIVWAGILTCSMIDGFNTVGYWLILLFFILAVIGEVVEYISGIAGAKKFGSSKKGMIGAVVGGMVGAGIFSVLLIGIGTVVGVFVGTFFGAFIGEYIAGKDMISSSKASFGAFLGRIAAIAFKIFIIIIITITSIAKYVISL